MRKRRPVTWTIQNEVVDALKSIATERDSAGKRSSVSAVASEKLRLDAEVAERIEKQDKQGVTA